MTRNPLPRLAAGAVLGALLAVPAGASAAPGPGTPSGTPSGTAVRANSSTGTVVFVRDHDVWIARGDGSGARALTRDGTFANPYGSPTQSDGGVVVATHVTDLVRMDQQGRVLGRLDPKPLPTSVGTAIDGTPSHAAISPDGRRIAYTFTKYLTPTGASAGFRYATGYTASDRLTDPAPSRTTYFRDPSWVGNGRTLQNGGAGSHVQIHDLGTEPVFWFGSSSTDFGNTALSRDGRLLAGILGHDASSTVAFMEVSGNATSGPPPGVPDGLCGVGPADGITNPAWGSGPSLFWEESDGVWAHPDVRLCGDVDSVRVLTNASQPSWSPASLSPPSTHGPGHAPQIRNTGRPAISGKARVGMTLRASTGRWNVGRTTFSFRWFRDGRAIAGATRPTRKLVKADRGRRVTVRVTARRAGYQPAVATSKPVRVKR